MDPALWDELAVYFGQAMEMPTTARKAFLDDIKRRDEVLWKELVSLMAFSENADSYLNDIQMLNSGSGHSAEAPENEDPYSIIGEQVGRYKVLEMLGVGGMGVVYKGFDPELERTVALKFLPPLLNENTEARQRFYIEARAASGLDHTNVCTIYEIGGTPAGHIFIAMGYYEGKTLREILDVEDLPVEVIMEYATQIAEGLAVAHKQHIIHRDIKPGNIMITPNGVVKILDFGLAKLADQKLTKTGMTMGTVAYMSPELIRGKEPSRASDIWSLGVLLYEMTAGIRPFRGAVPEAVMYSVINDEPKYARELEKDHIPPELKRVIMRCLQKDPAQRYDILHSLLQDLRDTGDPPREESPLAFDATKSLRTYLLIAGACLGLLILAWMLNPFGTTAPPQENERRVALLPFTTTSQNSEDDQILAEGLMHLLAGMLVQMDSPASPVMVIPFSEVISQEVQTATEADRKLGANVVVQGELSRLRDVVALSINLTNPRTNQFIGDDMSLLDQEGGTNILSTSFQEELYETLATILDIPLDETTRRAYRSTQPSDPDALAFYLQGVGYLHRIYQENFYDYAIQQFTFALEKDSLYAPAHAGLCEAFVEKYVYTADVVFADEARTSCERAEELGTEQPDVLVSLGEVYFRTGDQDKAIIVLNQALRLEPDHAEAYRWIGAIYGAQQQLDSAIAYFEKAVALKNNNWLYYIELGIAYNEKGDVETATRQFEIVRQLTPDNYLALVNLGVNYFSLGNVQEARDTYLEAMRLKPGNAFAHRLMGILLVVEGAHEAAIDTLQAAVDSQDLMALEFMGRAQLSAGSAAEADSAWTALLRVTDTFLQVDSTNVYPAIMQATAYASLNQIESSMAMLEMIPEAARENYIGYLVGRIYEMNNDRDRALFYIERAFKDYFSVLIMESDPELASLRTSEAYQDFLTTFYNNR